MGGDVLRSSCSLMVGCMVGSREKRSRRVVVTGKFSKDGATEGCAIYTYLVLQSTFTCDFVMSMAKQLTSMTMEWSIVPNVCPAVDATAVPRRIRDADFLKA